MTGKTRKKKAAPPEDHQSFLKRFNLKVTPSDIEKIDYAYEMAKYGHRNQLREGGERYFEHVRSTAIILIDELGITDVDIIIAALLHDILEDSFLLTRERIKITFGERASLLVFGVTKPEKSDPRFASNVDRHIFYDNQVKNSCIGTKLIKLADRLQNLRTLGACPKDKQRKKIQETKDVYFPLIEDVSKEYPEKAKYLLTQMNIAIAALGEVSV
jgi:(p)ppGpp synthase/HD superfamily hydrolase